MGALILEVDLCYQVREKVNVKVNTGLDFTTMYEQAKEKACIQILENNADYVSGSVQYLNCEFFSSKNANTNLLDDEIARLYEGFDAEIYAEQANILRAEEVGIAEYEAKYG